MAWFKVNKGYAKHIEPDKNGKDVAHTENSPAFESANDLEAMFPDKFTVSDHPPVKKAPKAPKVEEDEGDTNAETQGAGSAESKAAPKAKKSKGKAAKDKADSGEDDDVTGDFPLASKNDFTVVKGADGFAVKDGKATVSKKPLKTKKQVEAFIESHLNGGE